MANKSEDRGKSLIKSFTEYSALFYGVETWTILRADKRERERGKLKLLKHGTGNVHGKFLDR